MTRKISLDLTQEEINILIDCLDIAVKNMGLKGSYPITLLAMNISNQATEEKKEIEKESKILNEIEQDNKQSDPELKPVAKDLKIVKKTK